MAFPPPFLQPAGFMDLHEGFDNGAPASSERGYRDRLRGNSPVAGCRHRSSRVRFARVVGRRPRVPIAWDGHRRKEEEYPDRTQHSESDFGETIDCRVDEIGESDLRPSRI